MLFLNRLQGTPDEPGNQLLQLMPSFLDEYSLKYAKGIPHDQRVRLAKFIVRQCFLVVVSTSTLETAYRVFSVINDRGFNISLTDILKAEIIGKIEGKHQGRYTVKWEDIEEKLGRHNFIELFSHIRTIHRKIKPGKNILGELRDYVIKPLNSSQLFIDKVLHPYADAFSKIKNPDEKVLEGLKQSFYWLNQIDNFD